MLDVISTAETFTAFFAASGVGKTALTVLCDVYGPTGTALVTGASATEIGGGFYDYTLSSGSTGTAGLYRAVFRTTDTSVDAKQIPALWIVGKAWTAHLDADVSSRLATAGYTAPPTVTAIRTEMDSNSTKLANLDGAVSGIPAAVWNALLSGMTTASSIGKKLKDWVLGSDNKALLSTDAQTGVTIPTVTTVTGGATSASQATLATSVSAIPTNPLLTTDTRLNNLDATISSRAPGATALSTANWTTARAGYLDNLNVGGVVASHADITGLNAATALARVVTSPQYLKPASSATLYPMTLILTNLEGQLTDADGAGLGVAGITNVVTNGAGTDRSGNFSGWTHGGTGRYEATYSTASSATDEPLVLRFSGTIGGQAFVAVAEPIVADAFALAFNSSDRTALNALATTLGTPAGASLAADLAAVPAATWTYSSRSLTAAVSVSTASQNAIVSAVGNDTSDPIGAAILAIQTLVNAKLDATIGSRASQTSVTAIPTNPLLTGDARLNHLDADVSSRSAPATPQSIDQTKTVAFNNQDAVTAPTIADCLAGGWTEAFAKEPTGVNWVKQKPDNSGPIRTFPLTLDSNGNPIARS